jgi:hypothetical protein
VDDIQVGPSGIALTLTRSGVTPGSSQLDTCMLDPTTMIISNIAYSNLVHEQYNAVGDGVLVWAEGSSSSSDAYIKVRDLATGTTEEISKLVWHDEFPKASGRNVVWRGYDFGRTGEVEVFIGYWLGSGAMLAGVDLSGEDLSGLVFSGADLRGADLTGATLDVGALAGALIDSSTLFPDGAGFASTSFDLSDITLPSAIGDWLTDLGLGSADADDDPDGDGQSNLLEFALAGNAADAGSQPVSQAIAASAAPADFQYLTAVRRGATFGAVGSGALGADIDGVRYRIEGTGNLADFTEDITLLGRSDTPPAGSSLADLTGTDWEYVRFGFSTPPASGSGFVRVVVSEVP